MSPNSSLPLISVLVTVYNRQKYLAECLNSILASTFDDFELLIVDDASSDRSVEIARDFEISDRRVRLHINHHNLGDYPNRNHAAQLAKGKYLKYVDSDDLIKPDCLERLLQPLEENPQAAYALSYPRPENRPRPLLLSPREAYEIHFLDHQGIFSAGPLLAMIRSDRFCMVGGFRNDARNMGDTILWMELSKRWPMIIALDNLTWWRQHEGQEYELIREVGLENALTHCKLTGLFLREFLVASTCPLSSTDRKRVRRRTHARNFERIFWHLRHGRFGIARFELWWTLQNLLSFRQDLPAPNIPNNFKER